MISTVNMTWEAFIVIAVRKPHKLNDLLEENDFPKEDGSEFYRSTDLAVSKGLNFDDLLEDYDIYEGSYIMALTSGDFGLEEDIIDNMFTEIPRIFRSRFSFTN